VLVLVQAQVPVLVVQLLVLLLLRLARMDAAAAIRMRSYLNVGLRCTMRGSLLHLIDCCLQYHLNSRVSVSSLCVVTLNSF